MPLCPKDQITSKVDMNAVTKVYSITYVVSSALMVEFSLRRRCSKGSFVRGESAAKASAGVKLGGT